ncbi:MAG: HD domain-containing protein [Methanobacteriaceae archaeon]|nr:HD domain-containing protein [Methanobacteriaceae archaeon]
METIVIDVLRTPELQRLRRIKQLGLGHFVFPGAEHSRLVHSLGASYLAVKFAKQLAYACEGFLDESFHPKHSEIRDFAVAALCHDLGHGPLSHAFEREIVGENYNFELWLNKLGLTEIKEDLRNSKWHEIVGHALLLWTDGQLHRLLEQSERDFSKRISYMLQGKYYLTYLPRLLNSDIDVDRADFLLRDTHQCGVTYGEYNLDWLISTCTIGKTSSDKLVIGFDKRKALRIIEQFLVARRALYETVYYHKTVRSAEGMVTLFLRRLKQILKDDSSKLKVSDFLKPIAKVISGDALGPEELLSLDDFSLWVLIENIAKQNDIDDTVSDLAQRIIARDLFKIVPCNPKKINEFLRKEGGYERIYDAIKPFCRGKKEFYLHVDELKFSMFLENSDHMSFFIDENRDATHIRDHESLRTQWTPQEDIVRIYTLQEAVDAVKKLIG